MAVGGTVNKSGNKLADGVLSGFEWKGAAITFAFPDSSLDYLYGPEKNNGFFAVNASIQAGIRRALDIASGNAADDGFSVEGFTNLDIAESADHLNADIRIAGSTSADPTAYGYYPTADPAFDKGRSGDIWFGTDPIYNTLSVGNYAFATGLHELGHALGLKHGHQATRSDRIPVELKGKFDSLEYSVMTYHSYGGVKANTYTSEDFGYPQTYMMADIYALQHMYGADFTTNSGNTVYSWAPGSGDTDVNGVQAIAPGANRIFATIWDGNGVDTYDLSLYANGVTVDLRPGKYSVFSQAQRADLGAFDNVQGPHLASGNIYNAMVFKKNLSSLIENAIGGSGDDKLSGNAANNELTGNAGGDTFFFRVNSNADTVTDFGNGADVINLATFDIKSFNKLVNLMTDGIIGVSIDFGGGDTLLIENQTIANLQKADFIL